MVKLLPRYMKEYLDKLKDFLHSGTPQAKATQVALAIVAVAALPYIVGAAAVMGNAIQVFNQFESGKRFNKRQAVNAFKHLRSTKLIEYVSDKDGKTIVRITKKGESKLRTFSLEQIKIKKQKKWDGKWRLVMFDFPVRFTRARTAFRFKLKDLGFVQFQKSAWIYPYPCEDEIIFISDFYKVGKYVEILTVSRMLKDNKLKKHFNL